MFLKQNHKLCALMNIGCLRGYFHAKSCIMHDTDGEISLNKQIEQRQELDSFWEKSAHGWPWPCYGSCLGRGLSWGGWSQRWLSMWCVNFTWRQPSGNQSVPSPPCTVWRMTSSSAWTLIWEKQSKSYQNKCIYRILMTVKKWWRRFPCTNCV